jgi:hypothetical protein
MAITNQSSFAKSPTVTNPTIYNVTSNATPDTEFSQALSTGTKKVLIRAQPSIAQIKFYFSSGASDVVTINPGATYAESDLDLTGVTIYMKCDKASHTIEILEWT